jgi:UDP-N-acetylglucosamine 2-epimerase (non-hydrolysing)
MATTQIDDQQFPASQKVGQRVLVVFGTRPEAIKMAPVVYEFRASAAFEVKICVTAQHRQLLDQVFATFRIIPDFDLDLMKKNQKLADLTARILTGMAGICRRWKPDLVIVHGDTSTTFAASLAAFYEKIPVAHVEAGLRTHNKYSPWPEELNRCLTGVLAQWHFAPTESARRNLLSEGVKPETICVTGNTVVDSLRQTISRLQSEPELLKSCARHFPFLNSGRRLLLVTGHRRENFGDGLRRICLALRHLAQRPDVEIVYPLHLNPNVCGPVRQTLSPTSRVHLIAPLEYIRFVYLLDRCHLVLTDSGGIQEEAPFLGKPVLVMRNTTERPEAIESGVAKLVGTDIDAIIGAVEHLLESPAAYEQIAHPSSFFGDGYASQRIVRFLEAHSRAEACSLRSIPTAS